MEMATSPYTYRPTVHSMPAFQRRQATAAATEDRGRADADVRAGEKRNILRRRGAHSVSSAPSDREEEEEERPRPPRT